MKKLIILSIVFLIGISSVFAQAWTVTVEWDMTGSSCQVQDLVNDRFVVYITIYDVANDIMVVDNMGQVEANDATESNFDVQSAVQAHCNDGSLGNQPSYIIYATVRLVYMPTPSVYCSEKTTYSGSDCADFSSDGVVIPTLFFD